MGSNNTLTEIRRLLDAQTMTHYAGSLATTVDSAGDTVTITSIGFTGAEAVPLNWVRLTTIEFLITNISGASTLTWYLARDSAGTHAITPRVTTTWWTVGAGATAAALIDIPLVKITGVGTAVSRGQDLYLIAATNAGSCKVQVVLNWQSNSVPPALTPLTS